VRRDASGYTGNSDPANTDDGGKADNDGGGAPSSDEDRRCVNVEPLSFENDDKDGRLYPYISAPDDFRVANVASSWDTNCDDPTIVIALSENNCRAQDDHKLEFRFNAADIIARRVTSGQNEVRPKETSKGIQVKYTRPSHLTPNGEWGTCHGTDLGEFNFRSGPGTNSLTLFEATFQLKLPACDDSGNPEQTLIGGFAHEIRRSLEDVCPGQ